MHQGAKRIKEEITSPNKEKANIVALTQPRE